MWWKGKIVKLETEWMGSREFNENRPYLGNGER